MMKNNKGIALASLVITILVMLTITGTIIYKSTEMIKLRKLDDMYNDIILLNSKVEKYFLEEKALPVLENAIHKNVVSSLNYINLNPNDGQYYYVVDLNKLGGITLKYGKEYHQYNDDYTKNDVYIINEASHTIYYLKGITINEEDTKYSLEETYTAMGNGQIPIPAGFYYVGGDKSTGFVISDNSIDENNENNIVQEGSLQGNQFVWIPVDNYEDFKRYDWNNWDGIKKPNEIDNDEYTEADDSTENGTDESKAMYESVKLYGGFYIARYEAGYNNLNLDIISKNTENTYGLSGASINWGTSSDDVDPGNGAVTLARRNVSRWSKI